MSTSDEHFAAAAAAISLKMLASAVHGITFEEREVPGGLEIKMYCATCSELIVDRLLLTTEESDGGAAGSEDALAHDAHRRICRKRKETH